jgi:ABC-type arginine transport system permease subunit
LQAVVVERHALRVQNWCAHIDGDLAIIFLAFAGFLYLMISSISLFLLRKAEKRYSAGVKRGDF